MFSKSVRSHWERMRRLGVSSLVKQHMADFVRHPVTQVMRHILVDFARSRRYQKRGGGAHNVTFDENLIGPIAPHQDLVALDDSMKALAEVDPRKSKVVELRDFGGLSVEETAEVLQVTPRTVLRDWRLAKLWLRREIARGGRYDA